MARKRRRRRRTDGAGEAWESLSVQDRFVLRFWHRYEAFVPFKGVTLRTREQLDAKVKEVGGKAGLAKIFKPQEAEQSAEETKTVKARRREINRWKLYGYLAAGEDVDQITLEAAQYPVDQIAIEEGCRYDVARALFAIEWMESHLVLYEGEYAGEPFECRDWQDLVSRRLYGWVIIDEERERWVRRFTACIVFIPKKNKKSPTLAANAIYVGFGDGEPGNHFYLCAKDGRQAKEIAGTHAVQMVKQSALADECRINMNEMKITWYGQRVRNADDTKRVIERATIQPLSSSNARTTQSKEGLNGSFGVDESHVVDWEYVDIIKRMGISRPEPLRFDFSTAGNNPDGYGKDRFDYGLAVNAAKDVIDIRTCAAIYAVPQKLTLKEFEKAPVKYGRMANPAWGHTIHKAEFLADFEQSKRSITAWLKFLMYRLNVWQKTASPWLRGDRWDECATQYTSADLIGQPCGAAWDLMRSKDMASLGLVFPEDDASDEEARADVPYRSLVYYWMPEEAVDEYAGEVPLLRQWAADGWIRVVDGATINYRQIEEETAAILSLYDCQRFHFDPMFATASVQNLIERHGFLEERVAEFPQTRKYYSYPIGVFEKLVTDGKMHHEDNPVTNWQAGHVCVKDYDGKKILAKPDNKPAKKIDGIAALVMALDAALRREETGNVYDSRGLLSV